ncbi:hypothetical protein [Chryseobacterium sp. R2A-55]|uniref:hypothetical protein n=1 Tax=Chryseobacterium sp. R2A-55 TaxID=2744445 RepID=UPI001F326FB9|nr:hypothetical protein [Chryseobacterium sp. R2A-55]
MGIVSNAKELADTFAKNPGFKDFITNQQKLAKVTDEANKKTEERKKILSELERAELALKKAQSDEALEIQKVKLATQEANREAKIKAQIDTEQEGSLKRLRAELSQLIGSYDKLSAAERKEAGGKELQTKINALTKEVSDLEQATGRFQRNVGNYESALKGFKGNISDLKTNFSGLGTAINQVKTGDLSGGLLTAKSSVEGLGKALLTLIMSPVGLAVAAITALIVGLKAWYDYNEKISSQTGYIKKAIGTQGESLKALRAEISATADTMKVDFMELAKTINKSLDLGLAKDEFSSLASIQKGLLQTTDKNKFLSDLQNSAVAAQNLGMDLDQLRGMLLGVEKNGLDAGSMMTAMQKGAMSLSAQSDKLQSKLKSAFGSVFTDDLLKRIRTGKTSVIDAMQEIAVKSEKVGLNQQQQAELAKEMFGKAALNAGGYANVLKTVSDSYDLQNKKLSPLQESNLELTKITGMQERAWAGLFDKTGGGFEKMKVDFKLMTAKYMLDFVKKIYDIVNGFVDLYNESAMVRGGISAIGLIFKTTFGLVKVQVQELWEIIKLLGRNFASMATGIGNVFNEIKAGNFKKAASEAAGMFGDISQNGKKFFSASKADAVDYFNSIKDGAKGVKEAFDGKNKLTKFTIPTGKDSELTTQKGGKNKYASDKETPDSPEDEEKKKKLAEAARKRAYENAKAEIEARKLALDFLEKSFDEEKMTAEQKEAFYATIFEKRKKLLIDEAQLEIKNAKNAGEVSKVKQKLKNDELALEKDFAKKLKDVKIEGAQNTANQYKLSNDSLITGAKELTQKLIDNEKERLNKILNLDLEILKAKFKFDEAEIQSKLDKNEKLTQAELDYLSQVKELRKKSNKDQKDLDKNLLEFQNNIWGIKFEQERIVQKKSSEFDLDSQLKLLASKKDHDVKYLEDKAKLYPENATEIGEQIKLINMKFDEEQLAMTRDTFLKSLDLQSEFVAEIGAIKRLESSMMHLYNAESKEDYAAGLAEMAGATKAFATEGTATWKALSVFQAYLNMYVGISAALKEANTFMMVARLALVTTTGYMAISKIMNTKVPAYEKGTLWAERSGMAIVDEKGPELHYDKNWNLKDQGKGFGARLTQIAQGDKIIPADMSKIIRRLDLPVSTHTEQRLEIDYQKLGKTFAEENRKLLAEQKKEHYVALDGELVRIESKGNTRIIYRDKESPKPQRLT